MLTVTPGAASCVCTSCPHGPGFLRSVCAPHLHPSEGAVIEPAPETCGENGVMPGVRCLGRSAGLSRSFNLWLLPPDWFPLSRKPFLLLSTVSTARVVLDGDRGTKASSGVGVGSSVETHLSRRACSWAVSQVLLPTLRALTSFLASVGGLRC